MARIDTLPNFLTDVANSIREKTGKSEELKPEAYDVEIKSISSGWSDINVTNGTLDNGYYSSSGAIEPGTFINTSVISDLVTLPISGGDNSSAKIRDVAKLDNEYYVFVTDDGYYSDIKLWVFKGTTMITSVVVAHKTNSHAYCTTAGNGKDIFVLAGSVGYQAKIYHYEFSNNTLLLKTSVDTPSVGTMYYTNAHNITYFKYENNKHYCLACCDYDSTCRICMFSSDGVTANTGSFVVVGDTNNYSRYFGGFAKIDNTKALTSTMYINGSSGLSSSGTYLLTINDLSITLTLLTDIPYSLNSCITKLNNSLVLVIVRENNSQNILAYLYDISTGTPVFKSGGQISNYGTDASKRIIKVETINDNNFLILHSYYDGTNYYLKYIPCTITDNKINYGREVLLTQNGANLRDLTNLYSNKLGIFFNQELLIGSLDGLNFTLGTKIVYKATSNIEGITKTECTTDVAGEIWFLNKEVSSE